MIIYVITQMGTSSSLTSYVPLKSAIGFSKLLLKKGVATLIKKIKNHAEVLFLIIHTIFILDLAASLYFQFDLHSNFTKWKTIIDWYQ